MKVKRSHQDLIEHLKEQQGFLKKSCESYDSGSENEAKRISLCLRMLLHDTSNSKSILSQLGIKEMIRFLNTAMDYNVNNLLSSSLLTFIRWTSDGETSYARVMPLRNEFLAIKTKKSYQSFKIWWERTVLDDKNFKFSRKDVTLLVANKDGGAHVDEDLPENYHQLKDFCLASIRQIAFEVDKMLDALNIHLWRS